MADNKNQGQTVMFDDGNENIIPNDVLLGPAAPSAPSAPSAPINLDISQLAQLGRLDGQVEIGGFRFKLHTLRHEEMTDLLSGFSATQNDVKRNSELQIMTLAHVVDSVNGYPFESLCKDLTIKDIYKKRATVLNGLQTPVVLKLWQEYESLMERSAKILEPENATVEKQLGN